MGSTRIIKSIDDLTIMDDYMASRIFADPKVTSGFLSAILGKKIRIVKCYVQAQERPRKNAHYVTYDVLAYDDQGNIYNIEIQDYGEKDLILRLTYHEGILVTKALKKGMPYRELKNTTVVALCSSDPVGSGEMIYDSSFPFETYSHKKMNSRSRIIALNAGSEKTSGNVDIDQLMNYIKTGKRNNGKLTILLDDARKNVCQNEEERKAFMKELYQGQNETWNNMTEAERKQYHDEIGRELAKMYLPELEKIAADEKDKRVKKEINTAVMEEKKKSALKLYEKGMNKKDIADVVNCDSEQLDEWLVSERAVSYGTKKN